MRGGGGEGGGKENGPRKISIFGFSDFWLNKRCVEIFFIYGFLGVAKKIRRMSKRLVTGFICSQIWLNLPREGRSPHSFSTSFL